MAKTPRIGSAHAWHAYVKAAKAELARRNAIRKAIVKKTTTGIR